MPPSSGPRATARPVMAPQMPNAVPRSLPRKASASRASETANMMAPPTPCSGAGELEHQRVPARPARTAARRPLNIDQPDEVETTPADTCRPGCRRSAAARPGSARTHRPPTAGRREASMQGAVWMSGSATFTIVTSSSSMKVPRQTPTSVHHLFAAGPPPGGPPGARASGAVDRAAGSCGAGSCAAGACGVASGSAFRCLGVGGSVMTAWAMVSSSPALSDVYGRTQVCQTILPATRRTWLVPDPQAPHRPHR